MLQPRPLARGAEIQHKQRLRLVIPGNVYYSSINNINIAFLQESIPEPGVICPNASISGFNLL